METSSTSSSASSATRSLIQSLGIGGGMNLVGLAEDLAVAQYAAQTDRLVTKAETLEAQISAAANLKSMLLSLATSLGERIRVGDLSPQPQLSNPSIVTASLSGSRQPSGSYSLEVTKLAMAQTLASQPYTAATDATGSGTLTLRFGTIDASVFTEDTARAPVDIAIASGSTLADVASAINGANAGVSAYVADTIDGAKLVLKGEEGSTNAFVLDATEDIAEPGLSNLAWSPSSGSGQRITSADNAEFKVDTLAMTSASNTVSDAIPGVTLNLTGTNTGAPATMTFSNPGETIAEAMRDLTAALNEIAGELKIATEPKSGELALDSGARSLLRSMSGLAGTVIMPNAPEGATATLADLGLSTQRDGSFSLDSARLEATLARDPEGASAMFTTGLYGIYATIDGISRKMSVIGDPGSLAGSVNRYTEQLREVDEDQADLADKQEDLRARLVARFSATESRINASQSTLTFLKNQIAAWNGQGG